MIKLQGNKMEQSVTVTREKRYNKFTTGAKEYQKKRDIHRLSLCLYVIQTEKLYVVGGYTSVYDLGMNLLNLSKGTISGYISVAKKFLDVNTGNSIFASETGDYSYLQLLELKKLKPDEVKTLIKQGAISCNSTVKEIKQAVSVYTGQIKAEQEQAKEDSIKPIKAAYEDFNKAYNELKERVGTDADTMKLLQSIMDSMVVLYNENDRLWN